MGVHTSVTWYLDVTAVFVAVLKDSPFLSCLLSLPCLPFIVDLSASQTSPIKL